jgi:hypothetical protein
MFLVSQNVLTLPHFAVSSRYFAKIKDGKQAKPFAKRLPVELVPLFRETERNGIVKNNNHSFSILTVSQYVQYLAGPHAKTSKIFREIAASFAFRCFAKQH